MSPTANPRQIEVINADSTIVNVNDSYERYKLLRNVALRQNTTTLYCDLAILNRLNNTVEAFGNVKIIQADTVTIIGDSAYYAGNNRVAKILGKVQLNDKTIKLNTRRLDYDLNTNVAYYNKNGKIEDGKSTLTSKEGFYNTVSKIFMFYKNVNIVDAESNIKTDSLKYNTISKEAFFIAPTQIISKTDTLIANRGVYNTVTKFSTFYGRSTANTKDYTLTADTLTYDQSTQIGLLRGNGVIYAKKDSVTLTGQFGKYFGRLGKSFMTIRPLLKAVQNADTLFLAADSLVSISDSLNKSRKLIANGNVIIFRKDMQGKCDSLIYNIADSTIHFFKKPILWANNSQSEADTIALNLIQNKVRQINLLAKAFVIMEDSLKQYNQVKGRKIFSIVDKKSAIEQVKVIGNGQSIYYTLGEDKKLMGMNRVDCGKMNLFFKNNEVKKITFIGKPDGTLTPPHEIKPEQKELDGFKWRATETPSKQTVIAGRYLSDYKEIMAGLNKNKALKVKETVKPTAQKPKSVKKQRK